jgi:cytidylate kinase
MKEKLPIINIAIDGPSGAGKSTIAKLAAKEMQIAYVDTGAMYRAIALACLRQNVPLDDSDLVSRACVAAQIRIVYENNIQIVLLNGENVNDYLRTEEVSKATSLVARYRAVREKLVEIQRALAAETSCIMDGRDIGTKVLPGANVKIFLTASSAERAKRRFLEQQAKGEICDLAQIQADIEARDYQDSHREIDPLKQAEDAIYLDTSDMTVEEAVAKVLMLCNPQA